MKPALVVLDFAQNRARRYWPKPNGGFVTWDAAIDDANLGDDEGRAQIEAFRKGPEKKKPVIWDGRTA